MALTTTKVRPWARAIREQTLHAADADVARRAQLRPPSERSDSDADRNRDDRVMGGRKAAEGAKGVERRRPSLLGLSAVRRYRDHDAGRQSRGRQRLTAVARASPARWSFRWSASRSESLITSATFSLLTAAASWAAGSPAAEAVTLPPNSAIRITISVRVRLQRAGRRRGFRGAVQARGRRCCAWSCSREPRRAACGLNRVSGGQHLDGPSGAAAILAIQPAAREWRRRRDLAGARPRGRAKRRRGLVRGLRPRRFRAPAG